MRLLLACCPVVYDWTRRLDNRPAPIGRARTSMLTQGRAHARARRCFRNSAGGQGGPAHSAESCGARPGVDFAGAHGWFTLCRWFVQRAPVIYIQSAKLHHKGRKKSCTTKGAMLLHNPVPVDSATLTSLIKPQRFTEQEVVLFPCVT